ncbi:transmembrane emp24 domain-containing protein 3-like [Melospiza georgiana]|uniref:transmembrane emp24 domain-containing protein 3-like n=1 Tax=Melospiza georgiana TaxID=44398 RepID=UPI0025AD84DB|nr:transmembrane emp24 domain-containing protein 3-like [Melospiza georgiana]
MPTRRGGSATSGGRRGGGAGLRVPVPGSVRGRSRVAGAGAGLGAGPVPGCGWRARCGAGAGLGAGAGAGLRGRCRARCGAGAGLRVPVPGSVRVAMPGAVRTLCLAALLGALRAGGTELTLELPDSAQRCFHQELESGVKFTLDYQVISGGHYDVDCYVEDPNGKTIYQETKKQYDSFSHHTEAKGVYTFCFSNEFSTFSHKIVYFDFQVGDEPPILPDMNNRVTALTQLESACVTIHEMLKAVIDSQTHYRLREAQDRSRAEELNGRVSYWSVGETLILFVVSIGQVVLLKSFFTEKRPSSGGAGT